MKKLLSVILTAVMLILPLVQMTAVALPSVVTEGDVTNTQKYEDGKTEICLETSSDGIYLYELSDDDMVIILGVVDKDSYSGYQIIPDNIDEKTVCGIESGAFIGCEKLQGIVIPKTVTDIGQSIFKDCVMLEEIITPTIDFCEVFFSYETESVSKQYAKVAENQVNISGYVLPEASDYPEYDPDLKSPDGGVCVKSWTDWYYEEELIGYINYYKFIAERYYKYYVYPESFQRFIVYNESYDQTNYLGKTVLTTAENSEESLSVTDGKTSFYYELSEDEEAMLIGCKTSENEIAIPSEIEQATVTKIDDYAFLCCDTLSNVIIPDGVESIGSKTFYGCTALKEITIPETVIEIDENAFAAVTDLTIKGYSNSFAYDYAKENNINFVDISIQAASFSTSMQAFLNLEGLISMSIGYKFTDMESIDPENFLDRVGLLVWNAEDAPEEAEATFENCANVLEGAVYNSEVGRFETTTEGIVPKKLGDQLSFRAYCLNDDGTYSYSKYVENYSPKTYCYREIENDPDDEEKVELMASILNYGAAAQKYFNYRTDSLMNEDLPDELK